MSAALDVKLPPLVLTTEPSGLVLAAIERRGVPLFHARLTSPAGSSADPEGKEGLAQFTAELLRRGTTRRDARGLDDLVEGMGGQLWTDTNADETALGLTVPFELAREALDALLEVALFPTFPEAEVQLAQKRLLSALASDLDEPGTMAGRAAVALGFGKSHPYGHPVSGCLSSARTFCRADAVAFHRARYGPRGAVLSLCGSAKPEALLDLARAQLALAGFADRATAPLRIGPAAKLASFSALILHKADSTQAQVRLVAPGRARTARDWAEASLANTILGGGFTSILVDKIRVDQGLSYSVSTRLASNRHAGLSVFSSFTKNETLHELIDVALSEMRNFAASGPSREQVEKARSYLSGLFPFGLEAHESLAERIADAQLDGVGLERLATYRSRMSSVTLGEVQSAARVYSPCADGARLVVVGDGKVARKALAGLCPIEEQALEEYA